MEVLIVSLANAVCVLPKRQSSLGRGGREEGGSSEKRKQWTPEGLLSVEMWPIFTWSPSPC